MNLEDELAFHASNYPMPIPKLSMCSDDLQYLYWGIGLKSLLVGESPIFK